MNTTRSDAATSTDDIVKGRPLCLFYFTHPFGVLSCEPPTVLAPAPAAPEPAPPAPPAPFAPAAMARRQPVWPASRLPPYIRTLPPLRLPTPRDSSSLEGSDDVWPRSCLIPAEKKSLPPIELPTLSLTPLPDPGDARERRAARVRRLGPVGVRKGGARTRDVALVRLLRRAVATDGSAVERSPRSVSGALGTVRAAWQPPREPAACAGAGSGPRTLGGDESSPEMRPRAPAPPGLLLRRYSVPETVMRRYFLARELSEGEDESVPASGPVCAPRELVRRSALLRRLGPCRCDTRSADGSRSEVCPSLAPTTPTPDFAIKQSTTHDSLPVAITENRFESLPPPDILEIVVSETFPTALSRPIRTPDTRSSDCNLNIDEYVSNILVDSLNSLTDRLENMTVSIGGGDRRISVIEKEIKVKLQNKGVNTVVHLSPTSNNQIIFGNRELCERDTLNVPPAPAEKLFSDEFQASAESWRATARTESPCASLVDSLDDPMSPRAAPAPPPLPPSLPTPPPLPQQEVPSPTNQLKGSQLTPLSSAYSDVEHSLQREKCESFFVRMSEDNCACEKENIVVADHMPEKIKQRLYKRHRRREMRAQGIRRGAARRNAQRDIQRQCTALVDALIDDAIARVAREEYRYARIARHRAILSPNENRILDGRSKHTKGTTELRTRDEPKRAAFTTQVPLPQSRDCGTETMERVPPRRLYHKSEIHDGGKCIEILEIVEYANTSRSSSETNSDESLSAVKGRRSRIPVPIQDKGEKPRIRRASVATTTSLPVSTATESNAPSRRELTTEPCITTSSMRFERVFDVIPEERSSLSLESASDDMRDPPSAPPARRSAATSPYAPPGPTSASVDRMPTIKDCGHGRRSIGTQWTQSPIRKKTTSDHLSGEESALLEEVHSSSECECESVKEVSRRRAQPAARRRGRAAPRMRRRAPPPPRPPPPPDEPARPAPADTQHLSTAPLAAVNSGGEGWSLTLAGSCRAALPSRLALRLRFPSHAAAPPSGPSSTERYSDAVSTQTTNKSPVTHSIEAAPAIRYNSPGDSLAACGRARAVRRRKGAEDALPPLGAPALRRADLQKRDACCRCWAPAPPHPSPRRAPAAAPSPATPPLRPHIDCLHKRALLTRQGEGVRALAVLGCAIVPERRAAPATASQRDVTRRAAPRAAPRPRRHSLAAAPAPAPTDNHLRCFCYTYS